MKKHLITILSLFCLFACVVDIDAKSKQKVNIKNSSQLNVEDYIIELPINKLSLSLGNYSVTHDELLLSPLEISVDIFGNQNAIFLLPNLLPKSTNQYAFTLNNFLEYPKRTSAELSHKIGGEFIGKEYIGGYSWVKPNNLTIPGTFEDHSYYIKYEGPGWESDKVAYRFYLDNRNAVDVFAKVTPEIVLPGVGVDGFNNYHRLAAWGMDNAKVGPSLGLGSIAIWDGKSARRVALKDSTTCTVVADGKLRSQIRTIYYGWEANSVKCNLTSLITIDAGSSLSHFELITDKKVDNISTGIIKQSSAKKYVSNDANSQWSYIATFGKQSLNKDMQGLVVFFRTKQLKEITEDELNHVVVLTPDDKNYADYYIMPTWELDQDPVVTEEDFIAAVNHALSRLNMNENITITYK